jgi:hypothetical protein
MAAGNRITYFLSLFRSNHMDLFLFGIACLPAAESSTNLKYLHLCASLTKTGIYVI